MDTPKVTVIIPCHNQANTLRRAVESALDADEIVVFADPTSNGYIEKATDHIRNCRLSWAGVHIGNYEYDEIYSDDIALGVVAARNLAIEHADYSNSLIIPLDADDYFLPDGVNRLRDAWQPNSFVYGGWRNDDLEIFPARQPKRINQQNLCQATMLFHRDDWLAVGGYDPDFNIGWEDYGFQCALVNAGVEPIRIDYPIHHYSSGGKRSANALKYKDFLIKLMVDKYPAVFETKVKA
jgi:glycosyltransferase involved in cell wall biosynthesis